MNRLIWMIRGMSIEALETFVSEMDYDRFRTWEAVIRREQGLPGTVFLENLADEMDDYSDARRSRLVYRRDATLQRTVVLDSPQDRPAFARGTVSHGRCSLRWDHGNLAVRVGPTRESRPRAVFA